MKRKYNFLNHLKDISDLWVIDRSGNLALDRGANKTLANENQELREKLSLLEKKLDELLGKK